MLKPENYKVTRICMDPECAHRQVVTPISVNADRTATFGSAHDHCEKCDGPMKDAPSKLTREQQAERALAEAQANKHAVTQYQRAMRHARSTSFAILNESVQRSLAYAVLFEWVAETQPLDHTVAHAKLLVDHHFRLLTADPLEAVRAKVKAYNDQRDAEELVPDGDAYNDLLGMIL